MPRGVPVARDIEAMVFLVISERKIALPLSRLIWYAHWFGLPCCDGEVRRVIRNMVKAGDLAVVQDGKWKYFKIRNWRQKRARTP